MGQRLHRDLGLEGQDDLRRRRATPSGLRSLEFAHPEYPLGLPLLYAGISFLTGRWDDHAMALLFPLFQVATLLVLFGWLRRRGVSRPQLLGLAAATVALFEPLYSGFLTGMAEVPLSFGLLLFGAALVDSLDDRTDGAIRRLALAAALIAALKNEGLFLAAAGALLALIFGRGRAVEGRAGGARPRAPRARPSPALAQSGSPGGSRPEPVLGRSSLGLAGGRGDAARVAGLGGSRAASDPDRARRSHSRRQPPAVARRLRCRGLPRHPRFRRPGPAWLIETTLLRTTAALAPLAAAAVAVRFPGR